jgi:DNA (cytosine-5)-methyltransferase 1
VKYLSICSGIEAASVAWHDLQWQAVGVSEIEPFPCAVLQHRFPAVPNFGDMTTHANWNIEPGSVDLVVGGTPCQSFSVAGLRAGMADPRGNLALTFLAIVDRLRPEWVVWENVPGVLSSNGGRDFGAFLGALVELGYGFAYRILDAQHFGVAQRRRRVFVVANATDWRRAATVLLEPEGLRGDPAPRRPSGEGTAASASGGLDAVSAAVTSKWAKGSGGPAGDECQNLVAAPLPVVIDRAAFNQGVGAQYEPRIEASQTMSAIVAKGPHAVASPQVTHTLTQASARGATEDGTGRGVPLVAVPATLAVRRLTPVECERLQGFPDDWTNIPYRGKPAADGPRYKAIGNSMAVPVMRWIGERIDAVDRATKA